MCRFCPDSGGPVINDLLYKKCETRCSTVYFLRPFGPIYKECGVKGNLRRKSLTAYLFYFPDDPSSKKIKNCHPPHSQLKKDGFPFECIRDSFNLVASMNNKLEEYWGRRRVVVIIRLFSAVSTFRVSSISKPLSSGHWPCTPSS